jgi:hypothetical protein
MIEDNKFFKGKVREKLIKTLEGQINGHLDWLAKYVQQRSKAGVKNGIDPKIGSLLIESVLSQKL